LILSYDGDETTSKPGPQAPAPAAVPDPAPAPTNDVSIPTGPVIAAGSSTNGLHSPPGNGNVDMDMGIPSQADGQESGFNGMSNDVAMNAAQQSAGYTDYAENSDNYGPVGIKEDG
jgi:hypothetical protein